MWNDCGSRWVVAFACACQQLTDFDDKKTELQTKRIGSRSLSFVPGKDHISSDCNNATWRTCRMTASVVVPIISISYHRAWSWSICMVWLTALATVAAAVSVGAMRGGSCGVTWLPVAFSSWNIAYRQVLCSSWNALDIESHQITWLTESAARDVIPVVSTSDVGWNNSWNTEFLEKFQGIKFELFQKNFTVGGILNWTELKSIIKILHIV